MPPRQSARTSAHRDPASSPPVKSGQRVGKQSSSTMRTSRATRSQSRELDDDISKPARKNARPRGARHGSVDSMGSNTSADSKGGRKRKQTRATVAIGDLSAVAEEQERESPTEDEPTNVNDNSKVFQSPSAMSNLSGTTALTSQSVQKMAELDTGMIVDIIPDLFREALRLLELLAPSNASLEDIDTLVRELHVPGSGRGKRLHLREKAFESAKENYTTELFINPSLILRKIFNEDLPERGIFRPDPILYAANIAILVKELLIAQRDNPNTMELLQELDSIFFMPFLSQFESEHRFGSSTLRLETSDLALEIRTQSIIASLKAYRDEANFDPDQLLTQAFYDSTEPKDKDISYYEHFLQNGRYRGLAGTIFETTPLEGERLGDAFSKRIHQRIDAIREGFRLDREDIHKGDHVDFDFLNDRFSWNDFLRNVVRWSHLRMKEIEVDVLRQGGVEKVTALLAEKIKSVNSQIEFLYPTPSQFQQELQATKAKPSLLPAATIIPASAGKSLYNFSKSLKSLPKKRAPLSPAPPSNQQQAEAQLEISDVVKAAGEPRTPLRHGPTRNGRASAPGRLTDLSYGREQDDDEAISNGSGAASRAQMLAYFDDGERYDHKENTPIVGEEIPKAMKLRFVDPQPNAQRVAWSPSQQSENSESERDTTRGAKRKHQEMEVEEEDEEEEEEAFQEDSRTIDRSRRTYAARPVVHPRRPVPPTQSTRQVSRHKTSQVKDDAETPAAAYHHEKRRRTEEGLELEQIREKELQDRALQASAEMADEDPQPTPYEDINETAKASKISYMRRVVQSVPRGRQPWSADETQQLITLIGKIGCSWSNILKQGGHRFHEMRDQVALKDKARNIKVDYLLAGSELPLKFDGVALGKKEKERVKAGGMNPYRLEGEEVGYESHDMEGKLITSE